MTHVTYWRAWLLCNVKHWYYNKMMVLQSLLHNTSHLKCKLGGTYELCSVNVSYPQNQLPVVVFLSLGENNSESIQAPLVICAKLFRLH